jgi:16S rRNA (guanine527-N7)-methyltransferase
MNSELIDKYFPKLSDEQRKQFAALNELYHEWNEKINVISRKDIDNLYLHHVLHSLAIARMVNFRPGTQILDFGTGGGFPGVPLSILFPECEFKLIDGTGNKIKVAQEVSTAIGLKNCHPEHLRGEEEKGKYDFVVSRAVMPLPDLVKIVKKNISKEQHNALPNGILCLKGGDLQAETASFRRIVQIQPLTDWFSEDWFKEKYCQQCTVSTGHKRYPSSFHA